MKKEEEKPSGLCNAEFTFVLLTGPYEKEREFQCLKQKYSLPAEGKTGSIYQFHGSSLGNWHPILRNGLKVMSNTKYMSAGAAYGAGIYVADQSSISLGYSRSLAGWKRSMFRSPTSCVSLCEIIDDPKEHPAVGYGGGSHVIRVIKNVSQYN